MRTLKTTFIVTVFNEEQTIVKLLDSLYQQTQKPDEIVIVDGGSTDNTFSKINSYKPKRGNIKIPLKVRIKKGNRSVGRNEAIRLASNEIIFCSDSGNILDKNWIKYLTKPFIDNSVDVVAGYYKGKASNVFQKAVIPYALVMPDKVHPENFLPATRSVAFTKAIWKKVGKFDESLSHNEDYIFARKLKKTGAKIVFQKDAIVYWIPRNNLKQTFIMFWRFAFGDAEAGAFRDNVLLLFARYFFGCYFLLLCGLYKSLSGLLVAFIFVVLYIIWSITKNFRYVNDKKAFVILPILQFTADTAVLSGTVLGCIKKLKKTGFISILQNNKFLISVVSLYCLILLITINWGTPNTNHPFPYHMDEWHQLQAVANTFRYGTPNTAGSANGTMLQFIISGIYLIPFTLLKIVDPFSLEITNGFMRERVFEVLRLQTLLFGVLSIITLYKTAELLTISKKLVVFLFTFTPIWLALSGYFKYDIALLFWIILSLYMILRFAKNPNNRNFLFAAIPAACAIAVKISAVPLLPIYVISYFWFIPSWKKHYKYLLLGISAFLLIVVFFGMPDTLFGRGNILDYLYDNIIHSPQSYNQAFSGNKWVYYLFFVHFPILFGHGLVLLFLAAVIRGLIVFIQDRLRLNKKHTITYFLLCSFIIFVISLLPLQIAATGNRSLVLLPFLVLLIGIAFNRISKNRMANNIWLSCIILASLIQLFVSFAFLDMKFQPSPQIQASTWIINNIPNNATIGVENIPIYQQLPDVVQKEFYLQDYMKESRSSFNKYLVIDSKTQKIPSYVIITNEDLEPKIARESDKSRLVLRLNNDGYKRVIVFRPDIKYFQLFGNDVDYYFSGLIASPWTTSIYYKHIVARN
jgi:glycosyltransferase involved in cell wall biosynthesis